MACESIWRSKGSESQGMFCLRRTGWNVSCSLATILPLRATNLRDFERPPVVSYLVLEIRESRMHDFGGWRGGDHKEKSHDSSETHGLSLRLHASCDCDLRHHGHRPNCNPLRTKTRA